ncbi:DUF1499 domain-containing protein [Geomonas sp. Red32]|uniref:DUF1499 domain-containing protein n=1 Tax=Geomonas sp. Red32 TaxID=2912856 RepID=UPI00202D0C69|nr:DUF1499 domain-containing protein [Geomonas sp. Red32]MCM0083109.1 DUF1499 domain-containing protein [Geomonas sp. Red32]
MHSRTTHIGSRDFHFRTAHNDSPKSVPSAQRSTQLVLPLIAIAAAVFSLLLLLASGVGTRLDIWQFRTGLALVRYAGYTGLACALLAIAVGVLAIRSRYRLGIALSLAALICAGVAFGIPYTWKVQAMRYPRIHDITTDVDNPPKFVAVLPLRKASADYPGTAVAMQQLKAYPDLKTLIMPVTQDQAFPSALDAAKEMGWEIVAAVPSEGRIEAVATTFWFGFKDDVVIRVVPAGARSLIDVRSTSRVGISDLGTNAKRIRAYLAKLQPGR